MTAMPYENVTVNANRDHADTASLARKSPGFLDSKAALWTGRVLSALSALFLTFDTVVHIAAPPVAVEGTAALGFPPGILLGLGVVQAVFLVLYLVPRTSVLGAMLWTGYFGGAVAAHARIAHPLFSQTLFPVYVALFMWAGLWLRDARLRSLVPVRRDA